ncbi:MAG: tetratricopeptide repeat protein, partial [Myxococcales bacterium]|nr:tetratricopeptide repeat protein [Myxococcales bacterium]
MNKSKIIATAQKFLQKGQFSKAIKEYLKIVAEDSNDIRTWLKIADLYSKSGDLVNATETYRKVADYYAKQGFYLKAVAVNKQILKIDPNLVDVHIELANLYKQLGLLGDAIAQYQSVIAQLEYQGRRVDSIEVFRKMLEL